MATHVKVIAWLFMVFGVIELLACIALLIGGIGVTAIAGLSAAQSPEVGPQEAIGIAAVFGICCGVATIISAVSALPALLAGYGLLNLRNWARYLALVLACLKILQFPFGTALAVYALWVLLSSETAELFEEAKLPIG